MLRVPSLLDRALRLHRSEDVAVRETDFARSARRGWCVLCAIGLALLFAASDASAASPSRPATTRKHREKRTGTPAANPRTRSPHASESAVVARDGSPRVIHVTAQRAYLNAGHADGLTQGTSLTLKRRGRNIGVCQLEMVAEHHASCVGKGLREGDSFSVAAKKEGAVTSPTARAPLPSSAELDRRLAAVTSAPYSQVDYKGQSQTGAIGRTLATEIGLGHTSWVAADSPDGTFHQERLQLAIRGAPLSSSLRLFVDALALRWTGRPSGFRFPIQSPNQLFVHQLEVSSREAGQSLVFSAGRIWPFHAPGMGTLDGAQLGWRSRRGDLEGGLLAGAMPDPITLAPGTVRPLLGAYLASEQSSSIGPLRLTREEARLSLAHRSDLGWRGELESSFIGFWGRDFDLTADARMGFGRDTSPALFEAARLSLGMHSSEQLHLFAGARYLSSPPAEVLNPGDALAGNRSLHADFSATWLPTLWLSLAANAGHANDLQTAQHHTFAGPEIGFPRMLGSRGSLLLGYQQEIGDFSGKTAYVQLVASPFERLRLLERVSWFQNLIGGSSPKTYEAGLFSSIDWMFTRWLGLRASVFGRFSLDAVNSTGGNASRPYGIVASGAISGQF